MLTTFRLEIDRLLRAGVSLEEIDRRLIATAPVEPDRRDALWLYGWLRSEGRAPVAARAISSAQAPPRADRPGRGQTAGRHPCRPAVRYAEPVHRR